MKSPSRSDVLLAAAVTLLAQIETWSTPGYRPQALYAVAALVMTVPIAWRRVAPLAVLAAALLPLHAMALGGNELDSAYVMAVLLVAFHAVGAHCERRRAIAGLVAGLAGLAAVLLVERSAAERATAVGDFVFLAVIVGAVWALAVSLRERAARAGELEQHAQRLESEREQRAREAVAEERARIARELHDVVAHSISVIAVQTGSLRRRLRHERPADAEELSQVERTAREALAEMRRLLGLLRAEAEDAALAPQPGIGEVDRLAEQVRRSGLPVEVAVEGAPRPLPPGVDLAAYRIVQEALTNTLRHAGPARASVTIRYGTADIELAIRDDGRGPNGAAGHDGHGLVGMRERAALYGGSVEAGPNGDGGFAVRARLPIPAG